MFTAVTANMEYRIDYIGKVMRQPGDELYYTCIETLDVSGHGTIITSEN